ncbi:MAG: hypothetical protein E6H09_03070 [Bacteroidetes bacterium]|jgi:hypothetical protein|nr:MAG: hypothetical protein E6H09_03070 [Bacteroidota bacterium]
MKAVLIVKGMIHEDGVDKFTLEMSFTGRSDGPHGTNIIVNPNLTASQTNQQMTDAVKNFALEQFGETLSNNDIVAQAFK